MPTVTLLSLHMEIFSQTCVSVCVKKCVPCLVQPLSAVCVKLWIRTEERSSRLDRLFQSISTSIKWQRLAVLLSLSLSCFHFIFYLEDMSHQTQWWILLFCVFYLYHVALLEASKCWNTDFFAAVPVLRWNFIPNKRYFVSNCFVWFPLLILPCLCFSSPSIYFFFK